MLFGQWFCYGIIGILVQIDADLLLPLRAIPRVLKFDGDARTYLVWFPDRLGKGMISVLPASGLRRQNSASGEQSEKGGMPFEKAHVSWVFCCGMSEAYACRAWKWLTDTGKKPTVLPTVNVQDALMSEENEAVVAAPVVAAALTIDNEALLDVVKVMTGNPKVPSVLERWSVLE